MEEKVELKPVKKIICKNLFPRYFLSAYLSIFDQLIDYCAEIYGSSNPFRTIAQIWDKMNNSDNSDICCSAGCNEEKFVHLTSSGRMVEYNFRKFELQIDFGEEPSTTFAGQWLVQLLPNLQPEKWQGFGDGNIEADGTVTPFRIFIFF